MKTILRWLMRLLVPDWQHPTKKDPYTVPRRRPPIRPATDQLDQR